MKFLIFWAFCVLSWFGFKHVRPMHQEHTKLREAIFQLQNELRQRDD